jgi:leader peptidase (prepilin peptidase)/N-methyltransferase
LLGGGALFLLSWLYAALRKKEGMGMGDVKLLGMMGAFMGWRSLLFIALFASIQGVLAAVILRLAGVKLKPPLPEEWEEEELEREAEKEAEKETEKETGADQPEEEPSFFGSAIPFGPFLALAAVEYLFLGGWFFSLLAGR